MNTIQASIDIATAPDQVWRILARFEDYRAWNPFIVAITGEPVVDAAITVTLKLPHGPEVPLAATMTRAAAPSEMAWRSGLLATGIFDREHVIRVESNATGCVVTQVQTFDGVLAAPMNALTSDAVHHGLDAMNAALKRRVEAVGTN